MHWMTLLHFKKLPLKIWVLWDVTPRQSYGSWSVGS